ncbi:hypothetical protein ETI11_04645 [Macrococcoides canis]|uniref:Uncharacterized protein n=1 Tax=Macrococcoides canis TaxID=1855823 RepID=A0A4R6C856_9STAP|nr:hypothetical protein [Macrococcus canis]TDM18723.1 hypothetical protein ETI04_04355 [Macrococcus canis]TDM23933.1 hypothetical protein ETI02_05955 [Macrococcus canis]TDM38674.1 hypothetical protein ETI11_04645 [Macrococcus canis]TDM42844.1 hypothetical protein ETI09_00275 [Macrococcus canis]
MSARGTPSIKGRDRSVLPQAKPERGKENALCFLHRSGFVVVATFGTPSIKGRDTSGQIRKK